MSGSGPIAWLRDFLGGPRRPATRLSADEALRHARAAADRAGIAEDLEVMDVRAIDGRLCWVLGTTTKDAAWSVIVDDATGTAKEPEAWNGWSRP